MNDIELFGTLVSALLAANTFYQQRLVKSFDTLRTAFADFRVLVAQNYLTVEAANRRFDKIDKELEKLEAQVGNRRKGDCQ